MIDLQPYFKAGFKMIRLHENAKQPVQSWDVGEPTDVLERHNGNFGVLTGESGLVVLDIDTHGENAMLGYESLATMNQTYDSPLPETYTVTTPSGGTHYYFKLPEYAKGWVFDKQVKGYPSVDFQNGKTYVVGVGSSIDGVAYNHSAGDFNNIPEAPEWLLRIYKKVQKNYRPADGMTHTGQFLHDILQGAGEGGRNVWMTQVCGRLFRSGISFKEVKQWFYLINQIGCRPQLSKSEMEQIYKNILRSEQRNRESIGGNKNV